MNNLEDNDTLTQRIIGCAIEVHRTLGPGLLESAYEQCMAHEMTLQDIAFRLQVPTPIEYKGLRLDCAYKADVVVQERVIVELKSVEALTTLHHAQLLTYMKVSRAEIGQFQRPAPHRRGEAISHPAFRAGIQDTVFLVDLFCLHPLRPCESTSTDASSSPLQARSGSARWSRWSLRNRASGPSRWSRKSSASSPPRSASERARPSCSNSPRWT